MSSASRPSRSSNQGTMWEVVEIVAENGKLYQVRWAGKDPKTGKPWPLDWIPSSHCSPELVKEWERRKGCLSCGLYCLDTFICRILQPKNWRGLIQHQYPRRRRHQWPANVCPRNATPPVPPNLLSGQLASAGTARLLAPRTIRMETLFRQGKRNSPHLSRVQPVATGVASPIRTRRRVQVERTISSPKHRYPILRSKR